MSPVHKKKKRARVPGDAHEVNGIDNVPLLQVIPIPQASVVPRDDHSSGLEEP
jgi:hypothetical protein